MENKRLRDAIERNRKAKQVSLSVSIAQTEHAILCAESYKKQRDEWNAHGHVDALRWPPEPLPKWIVDRLPLDVALRVFS